MTTNIVYGIIGLLLLTLGRRLFWFFVAAMGMVAGMELAQLHMVFQPYWMVLLAGLAAGFIGALLAIFFQKAAIIVAGLAAGSVIAGRLMLLLGAAPVPWISLCAGILGAIILYWLFDWALIGISSCAGATLMIQAMQVSPQTDLWLFGILITAGIIVQSVLWRSFKIKKTRI